MKMDECVCLFHTHTHQNNVCEFFMFFYGRFFGHIVCTESETEMGACDNTDDNDYDDDNGMNV